MAKQLQIVIIIIAHPQSMMSFPRR